MFYKRKSRKEQENTESKALVRRQFHWFEVLEDMHRMIKRVREREAERERETERDRQRETDRERERERE